MNGSKRYAALHLVVLVAVFAGCESREIYVPPAKQLETAAPPVCPAPVVCPAAPVECPAPVVCPPAPAPVELSLTATVTGPLRAQVAIQWSARGCTPLGVELLGEAGHVVNLTSSGTVVDVINLTRPGSAMVARFGFWARLTCQDQRTQVAGPYIVTDTIRASQLTTFRTSGSTPPTLTYLEALPDGGWSVTWETPTINQPTTIRDVLQVMRADGSLIGGSQMDIGQRPIGTRRADHPWTVGTRVYVAPDSHPRLRAWIDHLSGEKQTRYVVGENEPIPAAAFTVTPVPAALTGWTGVIAPSLEAPDRYWVAKGTQLGLVDIAD